MKKDRAEVLWHCGAVMCFWLISLMQACGRSGRMNRMRE